MRFSADWDNGWNPSQDEYMTGKSFTRCDLVSEKPAEIAESAPKWCSARLRVAHFSV